MRHWQFKNGLQSVHGLQGLQLQGRNLLETGAEQGEDASYWSTVCVCLQVVLTAWLGIRGGEKQKDHVATMFVTRWRNG